MNARVELESVMVPNRTRQQDIAIQRACEDADKDFATINEKVRRLEAAWKARKIAIDLYARHLANLVELKSVIFKMWQHEINAINRGLLNLTDTPLPNRRKDAA